MVNEYYTIKEAAENWNLTERWVRSLCAQGKIKGAVQFGRVWAIPQDAVRPPDGRITKGEYVNWRNKQEKK
ncbi:MAG: helix-turn-helix domain-containing protein [Lachnospiraceae bacterium]|nr:helix-turn-helix domain-containing protein [Lachnospiraceae bacterium]